ncbi:MAG: hypothetical protein UZ12_BCD005001294 [Bacteroidetes bacterium OLB12]|nr:MAG: hypothetical protein UZ12_BCD005001294 [Bacteroidetes bacterium OLB12]
MKSIKGLIILCILMGCSSKPSNVTLEQGTLMLDSIADTTIDSK